MPAAPPAPPSTAWLATETDRLLDDAATTLVPDGFGWLRDDGHLDPAQGTQLWVTARMTHLFSLGALLGRPGDAALADHGLAAIAGPFRDDVHAGWYARLPAAPDASKTAYEHVFVLLAAASATTAGRPGAPALLGDAAAVIDAHFWDETAGACVEEWNRDFTVCDPYRGANANMHAVEAFLATADATGDVRWRDRALRIATLLIHGAAREQRGGRLPEHYDATWTPDPAYHADRLDDPFRPFGVTPGHGLEWSRLLLGLAGAFEGSGEEVPGWLRPAAAALFRTAVDDGWDGDAGLCYTTDWEGTPVVREQFFWVLAEAIAAADALYQATGDERYAAWYARWWAHARATFIDDGPGWVHEVAPGGGRSHRTWHGRPDFYHPVQATLLPRLPTAPTLAAALRGGLLDAR